MYFNWIIILKKNIKLKYVNIIQFNLMAFLLLIKLRKLKIKD